MTTVGDYLFNVLNTSSVYTTMLPAGATIVTGELPFLAVIQGGFIHVPFDHEDELHDLFSRQREQRTAMAVPMPQ